MIRLARENKKNTHFLDDALCEFGHKKLDISKTITVRSLKLRFLIYNNE